MEGKKTRVRASVIFFFLNQKGNSRSVCCYIYLVCAIFFFIREKSGKFQGSVKEFWIVMSVVSMLWAPDKRNLLSPPLLPGAKSYHYTSSFNLNMTLKNTMNVRYSDPNLLNQWCLIFGSIWRAVKLVYLLSVICILSRPSAQFSDALTICNNLI